MTASTTKLVAISGGPGAGKTTVLERLKLRGYSVVPEVARRIIAERKSQGLSARPDPVEFAQTIFDIDTQQYESAVSRAGLALFDRSLIDSLGGLSGLGLLTEMQRDKVVAEYPYHPEAFIFPPWQEIYRTDSERDQSYDESVRVYESVCRFYQQCGYTLVEVPRISVDDRCDFLIESMA